MGPWRRLTSTVLLAAFAVMLPCLACGEVVPPPRTSGHDCCPDQQKELSAVAACPVKHAAVEKQTVEAPALLTVRYLNPVEAFLPVPVMSGPSAVLSGSPPLFSPLRV